MASLIFPNRIAQCLFFALVFTYVASPQEPEDFGQFHVTVQKAGQPPMPINYVGILNAGDKMFVKVDQSYIDSAGTPIDFSSLLYKKLAVLFVPTKKEQLSFMLQNKSVTYQERDLCTTDWQPCQIPFEFRVPYASFPIVFLVSKSGYRNQLVKMVTPQNFQGIVKSSKVPLEMHIAAQKLGFLSDLTEMLEVKKIESRKVLHALFESASKKYKVFEKTGCDGADGKGMQNAKELANKRAPGAEPTQSEIYKGKLLCLVETSDAAVQAFNNLRQSGGFDVKSVVYMLANTALNIFIDKFPSMGIYFTVAKLALVILQEIFKKAPLEVLSAFANPSSQFGTFVLLSAPPDIRVTEDTMVAAEVTDPKEKEKLTDPPGPEPGDPAKTERARFFLPMELRGGLKFTTEQLGAMKPEPKVPCLTKGENGWGLDDKLLNDPLLRNLSVTLFDADGATEANATKKLVFAGDKTKKASGFIGVTVTDEQWVDISTWTSPSGTIRFTYGDTPVALPFMAPKARKVDVAFAQDSLFKFRRGRPARLVFKSKELTPNCVDKVTYSFGTSPVVQDLDDFENLTLTAIETESLAGGTGRIEFQQFGSDEISAASKITLLDHLPAITSVRAFEGDKFAVVQGTNLTEFKKGSTSQHQLVFVDLDDNEMGTIAFTFEPSSATRGTINLAGNAAFPQERSRFRVKMKVPGGESVESTSASVVAGARPAFITSPECIVGEDGSKTLAPTKAIDESSPFDLGPCVSAKNTPTLSIVLRRPPTSPYRFGNGQSYKVRVAAVSRLGREDDAEEKLYDTDLTVDNHSAVLQLPIAAGQFEPIRDIAEEGTMIRLKLRDPVRGESDWYTLGQEFVTLPKNLSLDCTFNNKCKLSGDLTGLAQAAVSENLQGEPQWTEVANVAPGSYVTLPLISIPTQPVGNPYYFYIKMRGSSRSIKVKFLPGNTSFVYKPALGTAVIMSPN